MAERQGHDLEDAVTGYLMLVQTVDANVNDDDGSTFMNNLEPEWVGQGRLLLRTSVNADHAGVRQGRVVLERAMQALHCAVDELSNIALAWAEMATNIVQYAGPATSEIQLLLRRLPSCWSLQVSHDGSDWDSTQLLHKDVKMPEGLTLAESGRGLALIQQMIEASYYRSYANNEQHDVHLLFLESRHRVDRPRVLLVEDDASLRLLIKDWLVADYEVYDFPLASEALSGINEIRPDLVLSDVRMPGMDGLAMREKMKLDKRQDLIPFVFITADEDITTRHHATTLGIDDFLRKPVGKDNLLQTIERVIQRYRGLVKGLSDRIDQRVSSALQPTLPVVIGDYNVMVKSLNGGTGGGDFVFHTSRDGAHYLLLADIMGHDETAKFFSYAHAGYLRGLMQGVQDEISIETLMQRLSDGLHEDALYAQTTLTAIGIELREDGHVSLAAAGHPQPVIINDDGLRYLPVDGCMPGLLADQTYEPLKIELRDGDKLCLYTDGWFDSSSDNYTRLQRKQRLQQVLVECRHMNLHDCAETMMLEFDRLTSGKSLDDATIIFLETRK